MKWCQLIWSAYQAGWQWKCMTLLVFDGPEAKQLICEQSWWEFQPCEIGWSHPTHTKPAFVLDECPHWPVVMIQEMWVDKEVLHQQIMRNLGHCHGQLCTMIHSYFWTHRGLCKLSTKFFIMHFYSISMHPLFYIILVRTVVPNNQMIEKFLLGSDIKLQLDKFSKSVNKTVVPLMRSLFCSQIG